MPLGSMSQLFGFFDDDEEEQGTGSLAARRPRKTTNVTTGVGDGQALRSMDTTNQAEEDPELANMEAGLQDPDTQQADTSKDPEQFSQHHTAVLASEYEFLVNKRQDIARGTGSGAASPEEMAAVNRKIAIVEQSLGQERDAQIGRGRPGRASQALASAAKETGEIGGAVQNVAEESLGVGTVADTLTSFLTGATTEEVQASREQFRADQERTAQEFFGEQAPAPIPGTGEGPAQFAGTLVPHVAAGVASAPIAKGVEGAVGGIKGLAAGQVAQEAAILPVTMGAADSVEEGLTNAALGAGIGTGIGKLLSPGAKGAVGEIVPERLPVKGLADDGTVKVYQGGDSAGFWTTDAKRAASFGEVQVAEVTEAEFKAGQAEAAKQGQPTPQDTFLPSLKGEVDPNIKADVIELEATGAGDLDAAVKEADDHFKNARGKEFDEDLGHTRAAEKTSPGEIAKARVTFRQQLEDSLSKEQAAKVKDLSDETVDEAGKVLSSIPESDKEAGMVAMDFIMETMSAKKGDIANMGKDLGELLEFYRISAMLSKPSTHFVNLSSTQANIAGRHVATNIGAGIDKLAHPLAGRAERNLMLEDTAAFRKGYIDASYTMLRSYFGDGNFTSNLKTPIKGAKAGMDRSGKAINDLLGLAKEDASNIGVGRLDVPQELPKLMESFAGKGPQAAKVVGMAETATMALKAEDRVMFYQAFAGELNQRINITARQAGLEPDDVWSIIRKSDDQITQEQIERTAQEGLEELEAAGKAQHRAANLIGEKRRFLEGVEQQAREMIFTNKWKNGFLRDLDKAILDYPPMRFLIPFRTTIGNVAREKSFRYGSLAIPSWMIRRIGAGSKNAMGLGSPGFKDATQANIDSGKIVIGLTTMMLAWELLENDPDIITPDFNRGNMSDGERQTRLSSGQEPGAIKIDTEAGAVYNSFLGQQEPFGDLVVAVANVKQKAINEARKQGIPVEELDPGLWEAYWKAGLPENLDIFSEAFGKNMEDIVTLATDSESGAAKRYVESLAGSLVPNVATPFVQPQGVGGARKFIDKESDIDQDTSFLEAAQTGFNKKMGNAQDLRERRDIFGEPTGRDANLLRDLLIPGRQSATDTPHEKLAAIVRDLGVFMEPFDQKVIEGFDGQKHKLTTEQKDIISETRGNFRQELIGGVVNGAKFQEWDRETQRRAVEAMKNKADDLVSKVIKDMLSRGELNREEARDMLGMDPTI